MKTKILINLITLAGLLAASAKVQVNYAVAGDFAGSGGGGGTYDDALNNCVMASNSAGFWGGGTLWAI